MVPTPSLPVAGTGIARLYVREGWPEVADFNDDVMRVGLAGGTLSFHDQELILYRNGRPEQVFMNLDYSPVRVRVASPRVCWRSSSRRASACGSNGGRRSGLNSGAA
jgi:hypothetical protein